MEEHEDPAGEISVALRGLRRLKGMSQVEAARRSGIGRTTLNRIEKGGSSPDITTVARLLSGLGLTFHDLADAMGQAVIAERAAAPYGTRVPLDEAVTRLSKLLEDACRQRDDFRERWERAREELAGISAAERAAEAAELDALAERAAAIVSEREAARRERELEELRRSPPEPAEPTARR